jgi:hypothetical protein
VAPAHEKRILDTGAGGRARCVIRPASFTAARAGIVGDLLKDAANSLVRVVGSGENHWPLDLRPGPRRSSTRGS